MKDIVTPVPPEEVRQVIKKCLENAALVNYTRISEYAKIEGNPPCYIRKHSAVQFESYPFIIQSMILCDTELLSPQLVYCHFFHCTEVVCAVFFCLFWHFIIF